MEWDDQKCNAFQIAKRMVKTNQDIIGEQNYYWWRKEKSLEKLSWEAFEHRVCMGQQKFVPSRYNYQHTLLNRQKNRTVRDLISEIKNGKAAGLWGVVSEMVKTAKEVGVEMVTDIVNQIIVDRRSWGNNNKVI